MIWILGIIGAVLASAVTVFVGALVLRSKLLLGMLATGAAVVVLFFSTAVALRSPQPAMGTGTFSHDLLEADRMMTEQMATYVGPGMEAQMPDYGMLARSANDAYLRALELHTYQVNKMMGRVP